MKSLFFLKHGSFYVASSILCGFTLLFWWLTVHVYFGSTVFSPNLPFLVCFIAAVFAAAAIPMLSENSKMRAISFGVFLGLAVFLACMTRSDITASLYVSAAQNRLKSAESSFGRTAAIQNDFLKSTRDAATTIENIEMVRSISSASSNRDLVLRFLVASKVFGYDAAFVAKNGLVRRVDQQGLFRHVSMVSSKNAGVSPNVKNQKGLGGVTPNIPSSLAEVEVIAYQQGANGPGSVLF